MSEQPSLPPRPMDSAGPPPDLEATPLPWWTLPVAVGAAFGCALVWELVSLVFAMGSWRTSVGYLLSDPWNIAHCATPAAAAFLAAAGASVADRVVPDQPRVWRWVIGMGVAGAVPLSAMRNELTAVAHGSSGWALHTIWWEALLGCVGGAALGCCLGFASRARRWSVGALPLAAFGYALVTAGLIAAVKALGQFTGHMPRVWLVLAHWGANEVRAGLALCLTALVLGEGLRRAWNGDSTKPVAPLPPAVKKHCLRALAAAVLVGIISVPFVVQWQRESELRDAAGSGGPHLATIGKLLEAGANPNAPEHGTGETALHKAAMTGNAEHIRLLLKYGADIRARTEPDGLTPLHCAARRRYVWQARVLIAAGADVNAQDCYSSTPLHHAASQVPCHVDVARELIAAGADLTARNVQGQTPADVARSAFAQSPKRLNEMLLVLAEGTKDSP